MKVENREEVIKLLKDAESASIINSLNDAGLRRIEFTTSEGCSCYIEWYCNLCTLYMHGFSMWFDDIAISKTHPFYEINISLSHCGVKSGFIGLKRVVNGK